jgi:hypothetical protein
VGWFADVSGILNIFVFKAKSFPSIFMESVLSSSTNNYTARFGSLDLVRNSAEIP